jgi:hypothetical protein
MANAEEFGAEMSAGAENSAPFYIIRRAVNQQNILSNFAGRFAQR